MSAPLLTTKLYIPPPRPGFVPRPRLVELLNKSLDRKLTLLSAPAGFGKTTLISEWVHQSEVPTCWLTLDESDNDIGRFLAYFIASLQSIDLEVDERLPTLLQSPQQTPIENVLIPLINEISYSQKNFVFVLDDYHLIQSEEIHAALTFILEHSPPTMHLVITTRADPPIPLARMRARGQMTEIRASHLRFSVDEGEMLLNQIQGLILSTESVKTLINRADGWIAALQMISIALKDRKDPAAYIRDLSGSQTYIADYLTHEVIHQQPEHIQEFLVQTSFLDRLSGPLCDAVRGQEDSQGILKKLREANLFLESLDDENHWFRYHRLFASLLQQRLLEIDPESLPALFLRASQWFERHGYPAEAIEYAFRGDHTQRAADLIESNAIATLTRSEIKTFTRWVQKLPEELIYQKPSLGILFAWALLIRGDQMEAAKSLLQKIAPENEHIACRLDTVKAILALYEGEVSKAVGLARQAWNQLPPADLFFRNIAGWNLSGALAVSGDTEAGFKVLREVVQTSLASHNYLVAIVALCRQALAKAQVGKLHEAKGIFERAIEIAISNQKHPLPAASEALMGLGRIHWEWDQIETAREILLESINLSKRWREIAALDSYVALAHVLQSQGDAAGANQRMAEALKLAVDNLATETDDRYVASEQAHLWVRQGDLRAARRWANERGLEKHIGANRLGLSGSIGANIILRYELIVYARVLIAAKQIDAALRVLDLVLPSLEQLGYLKKIMETHILRAMGLYAREDVESAIAALETALDLARPEGFTRVFLDEGEPMAALLQELVSRGGKSKFASGLLSSLTTPARVATTPSEYLERLSEREIEILRMLTTDLSAPEIAERLHIAVTTMRTHTKNIYRKLGVHSRFEAVVRGKELNLL